MASEDLKAHALNSSQDFYALLGIEEGATDAEIRRAYRITARKYHPDKVGANEEALKTFHLLQIAYDVLSDASVKELYDNARKAKQAKAERDKAYEGRRKWMKEDLERRESGAFKRKRDEVDAEEEFERELMRLAEDGKRRRKERENMLRKEAEEIEEEARKQEDGEVSTEQLNGTGNGTGEVDEMDRSITLRFSHNESTSHIDRTEVIKRFERFGPIEEAILREKKIKIEGQKHRQPYITAVLAFKSVVGAHAAVTDFPKLCKSDSETFGIFEAVTWASGHPPAFITTSKSNNETQPMPDAPSTPVSKPGPRVSKFTEQFTPIQSTNGSGVTKEGLKRVPSFGSFKSTPAKGTSSPSLDEITMIRLKNAERRRMEEKIRKEEAEAEKGQDDGEKEVADNMK